MWEEAKHLSKIVQDTAQIEHSDHEIHLCERDKSAVLKNVYICNITQQGISLKADCHAEAFFKKNYGNRRCDCITLSEYNSKRVALFIDMKSKSLDDRDVSTGMPQLHNGEYPDYVCQLKSSSCFFDFLSSVVNDFCNCDALYQYTKESHRFFVILHNKKLPSLSTIIPRLKTKPNNTPETALVLYVDEGSKLNFESLIIEE